MARIHYSSSIGNSYVIENGEDRTHILVARAIARKLGGLPKAVRVEGYRDNRAVYNMMAAGKDGSIIRNNIWFEIDPE